MRHTVQQTKQIFATNSPIKVLTATVPLTNPTITFPTGNVINIINIFNNKFIGYDGSEGINARETWATRIYNNKMYSGTVSAGRQTIVESNEFFDSSVKLPNSQSKAVNNVFFNSYEL